MKTTQAEAETQAETMLQYYSEALDQGTAFFELLMEIAGDERIDYKVRIEYLNRASKLLNTKYRQARHD